MAIETSDLSELLHAVRNRLSVITGHIELARNADERGDKLKQQQHLDWSLDEARRFVVFLDELSARSRQNERLHLAHAR